jgi:hypothetical protein
MAAFSSPLNILLPDFAKPGPLSPTSTAAFALNLKTEVPAE